MTQPLRAPAAKALIRKLLADGDVFFWKHASEEMAKDGLTLVDIENVLRGGVVEETEYENGQWRHRVRTARIVVVVQMPEEDMLQVVTAWKVKP